LHNVLQIGRGMKLLREAAILVENTYILNPKRQLVFALLGNILSEENSPGDTRPVSSGLNEVREGVFFAGH